MEKIRNDAAHVFKWMHEHWSILVALYFIACYKYSSGFTHAIGLPISLDITSMLLLFMDNITTFKFRPSDSLTYQAWLTIGVVSLSLTIAVYILFFKERKRVLPKLPHKSHHVIELLKLCIPIWVIIFFTSFCIYWVIHHLKSSSYFFIVLCLLFLTSLHSLASFKTTKPLVCALFFLFLAAFSSVFRSIGEQDGKAVIPTNARYYPEIIIFNSDQTLEHKNSSVFIGRLIIQNSNFICFLVPLVSDRVQCINNEDGKYESQIN